MFAHGVVLLTINPLLSSSPVSSVRDLRTKGHWFDPQLDRYCSRGLIIVITTGLIALSSCPLFRGWCCGIAACGFERIFGGVLVKRTPRKLWIVNWDRYITETVLKTSSTPNNESNNIYQTVLYFHDR